MVCSERLGHNREWRVFDRAYIFCPGLIPLVVEEDDKRMMTIIK